MRKCLVNITTSADGVENTITREGRMSFPETLVKLVYQEENALVCMEFCGSSARVERSGDYTLKLSLQSGKSGEGEIGINGASGSVGTFTDRILYSTTEDSLRVVLHYDLLIAGQRQKMRLNIRAKFVE